MACFHCGNHIRVRLGAHGIYCPECGAFDNDKDATKRHVPAQAKRYVKLREAAEALLNQIASSGTDIPPRLLVDLQVALIDEMHP